MTKVFDQIINRVDKVIARAGLAGEQNKFLLAVSGGPDSVLMMRVFHELKPGQFRVAHFNYQQRASSSDEDEKFVSDLTKRLSSELSLKSWDEYPQISEAFNFQNIARQRRYSWMRELCDQYDLQGIVTAHHVQDLEESFFLQLGRGAGLRGLAGMQLWHEQILRPLLTTSKTEILTALDEIRQNYRIDETNKENHYRRNKIRNELMPYLRQEFPEILKNVTKTSGILSDHWRAWQEAQKSRDIQMPLRPHSETDWLRLYYHFEKEGLTRVQIENMKLAIHGTERKEFPLDYRSLVVSKGNVNLARTREEQEISFELKEQEVVIDHQKIIISRHENLINQQLCRAQATLPERYLGKTFILRSRRPGDKIASFGMQGKKQKVKEILINHKVDQNKQEALVMTDKTGELIWLVGIKTSEHCRLKEGEGYFLLDYKKG